MIEVKLDDLSINLSKKGLMFGVEYLGHIDQNGNFVHNNKLFIRPVLTDATSKLYRQNTMIKDIFSNKIYIKTFNKHFKDLEGHIYSRNLALSFIIEK